MLHYRHIQPAPELRPYIQCFHTLVSEGDSETEFERFTPDGCAEVNFNLSASAPQRRESDGSTAGLERAYTVVRSTQPYFMLPPADLNMVGVRFHPWGLHRFTRTPLSHVADSAVGTEQLFGPAMERLHEQLINANGDPVPVLERFFLDLLPQGAEDAMVMDACRRIQHANGALGMKELYARYSGSERRFQQRFAQCVGIPAKGFARLTRFRQALRTLTTTAATQSDLAFEGGFFDQAHFVNEFKAFAGVSPLHYRREHHPINDAAVLELAAA